MDWSLALVSQGIETTIEESAETGSWELVIAATDSEKAFKTLRQYRLENREWPWRQSLPWPAAHFDWASVAWAALLIFCHWLGSIKPELYSRGVMASQSVHAGEWWRVFTAMTLHADGAHLAANLSMGTVLLGLTMGRYGTGTGLLAAYFAGAAGNVASLWFSTRPFNGLGASGIVMGALGLLAAQTLLPMTERFAMSKYKFTGLIAGVMLFILFGLSPGSDLVAHFGGFVIGVILGIILVRMPTGFCHSPKVNVVGGMIAIALVTGTWWLALKS